MGKVTKKLEQEHRTVLSVLQLLDKMISETSIEDKVRHYDEMVYFLKMYADLSHHRKEEILFDELCQLDRFTKKELIASLLKEHDLDRRYITYMDDSLEKRDYKSYGDAAVKYRDLVKEHMEKENEEIFVLVDQLLDDTKQQELLEIFKNYESSVIGEEIYNELNSMIATWEKELGLLG